MSNCKPDNSLRLGLNVLIEGSCGGKDCSYHTYPYEIKNILNDNELKMINFKNDDDVWDYIALLCEESKEHRRNGSSFSILKDIWEQLPFFTCVNTIINEKDQKDIAKYIYCKDTNTPPHKGSFGDTPHIWIQKYYIIKQALYLRDQNSKN